MPRKILHLDLDAFFCAVEELRDPTLVGKPFAVGGRPEQRGVVSSCSYPARRCGVRSAMPMGRALRLCPDLIIISARHGAYSRVSEQVMDRLHALTPLVEQISIDEAFLDVSDLPESGEELARRLQARIRHELSLPCSLGVATNKLLAKTANDVGKLAARGEGPPNAITVVPPGDEAAFLAPLPLETLWGVGPKTAARLEELGLRTIADLVRFPEGELARMFGKLGHELALRARGVDDRPLVTSHELKSVSQEVTYTRDVDDGAVLRRTVREQAEAVSRRLREAGLYGTTVKLKIRWPDFTTLTRQTTLGQATDLESVICENALALLEKVWKRGQKVRLLGVGMSGLGLPVRQLSLWESSDQGGSERERRLRAAVDSLREKYGEKIVRRGSRLMPFEE